MWLFSFSSRSCRGGLGGALPSVDDTGMEEFLSARGAAIARGRRMTRSVEMFSSSGWGAAGLDSSSDGGSGTSWITGLRQFFLRFSLAASAFACKQRGYLMGGTREENEQGRIIVR